MRGPFALRAGAGPAHSCVASHGNKVDRTVSQVGRPGPGRLDLSATSACPGLSTGAGLPRPGPRQGILSIVPDKYTDSDRDWSPGSPNHLA